MPTVTHRNELLVALRGSEGDPMDREVRDIMTPGVISIVEDASLRQVYRAMITHGVHALLVLGVTQGKPLGWVTARGLLTRIDSDDAMATASAAVTERAESIEPSATARDALAALSRSDVSHLLVQRHPDAIPEGVVTELDLVALRSA